MVTITANQGDTVDLICWRHYGRTAGITESVLAANPGIAAMPHLPMGTQVILPELAPEAQRDIIQLWS